MPDILVAGEIEKLKDGNFKFEHEWLHGDNPNLELEQDNFLDSEDLWKVDLRSSSFKTDERKGVLKVEKNGMRQRFGA